MRAPVRRTTAAVLTTATLAACGGGTPDVHVVPPTPSASAARTCAALAPHLPARLEALARRTVLPVSPFTSAWGKPPVVFRCGIGKPHAFTSTSEVYDVNGLSWFREVGPRSVTWTLVGRAVWVSLEAPKNYRDQGPFLVDLAPALSRLPAVSTRSN